MHSSLTEHILVPVLTLGAGGCISDEPGLSLRDYSCSQICGCASLFLAVVCKEESRRNLLVFGELGSPKLAVNRAICKLQVMCVHSSQRLHPGPEMNVVLPYAGDAGASYKRQGRNAPPRRLGLDNRNTVQRRTGTTPLGYAAYTVVCIFEFHRFAERSS